MRIVGGRLRGRRLAEPKSQAIRPTTDRVRESLFNILEHGYAGDLEGARVLDIFAGTGALGIEALSRGAAYALFIETGAEARALLRQNTEMLALAGCSRIFKRDATRPGPCPQGKNFNLVFADPPYGKALGEKALSALSGQAWLTNGALIVLEEAKTAAPRGMERFTIMEQRDFGATTISFFRHEGDNGE